MEEEKYSIVTVNLLNFVYKYAKSIKHDLVLHLFLVLLDGCYEDVIIMINVVGVGGVGGKGGR